MALMLCLTVSKAELMLHLSIPYAGPVVWNNLLVYIRAEPDIARFKNILKTYFFRLAFDLLGYFLYFSPVVRFYSIFFILNFY